MVPDYIGRVPHEAPYQRPFAEGCGGGFVDIKIGNVVLCDTPVEPTKDHVQVPGDESELTLIKIKVVVVAHANIVVQMHYHDRNSQISEYGIHLQNFFNFSRESFIRAMIDYLKQLE